MVQGFLNSFPYMLLRPPPSVKRHKLPGMFLCERYCLWGFTLFGCIPLKGD